MKVYSWLSRRLNRRYRASRRSDRLAREEFFPQLQVTRLEDRRLLFAPVIGNLDGDLGNDANQYDAASPAALLDNAASGPATVTDADNPADFAGATLTVKTTFGAEGADVVGPQNDGAGNVLIGDVATGIIVGTFSGGNGGGDLVITFNAAATEAVVSEVLQNIRFENRSPAPANPSRLFDWTFDDGTGETASVTTSLRVLAGDGTANRRVWDGDTDMDGDGIRWSDPFNWQSDIVPDADDIAQFTGISPGDVNLNGLQTVGRVELTAGGYNITGGTLDVERVDSAGDNQISAQLRGAVTSVEVDAGTLTLSNPDNFLYAPHSITVTPGTQLVAHADVDRSALGRADVILDNGTLQLVGPLAGVNATLENDFTVRGASTIELIDLDSVSFSDLDLDISATLNVNSNVGGTLEFRGDDLGVFIDGAGDGLLGSIDEADPDAVLDARNGTTLILSNIATDMPDIQINPRGNGTVVFLTANPTYQATTFVLGGTLELQDGQALGLASSVAVDGGTLRLTGVNLSTGVQTVFRGGRLTSTGSSSVASVDLETDTNIISESGTLTITRIDTIDNDPFFLADGTPDGIAYDVIFDGVGDTVVNGVIGGGATMGTDSIRKQGSGTLTLNASNAYSGTTTIDGGVLVVAHDNALGQAGAIFSGRETIVNGAEIRLENNVNVAGEGLVLGSILSNDGDNTWTGEISLSDNSIIDNDGGTLTVDGNIQLNFFNLDIDAVSGSQVIINGNIDEGINEGGANASTIRHVGQGTTVVTADNNYTAGTQVIAGTLLVNNATGSGTGSGDVDVQPGATLGGTGTIGGAVNNLGIVAPGVSPGVLNSRDVHFQDGSLFEVEIGGTSAGNGAGFHDQLNVLGSVTIDANATLSARLFGGFVPSAGDTFTIITNDGMDAIVGTFAGLPDGAAFDAGGQVFTISYDFDSAMGSDGGGNDVALIAQGLAETAVSIDDESGNLVIADINGGTSNDQLTIQSDTANHRFIISDPLLALTTTIATAIRPDAHTVIVPFADVTGDEIIVNTLAGNDVLTADFLLGDIAKRITYNGGDPTTAPGDSLVVTGGAFDMASITFGNLVGPALIGTIDWTTAANSNSITFTGLEPVDMTGSTATDIVFNLPAGPDNAQLSDLGNGMLRLASADATPTFEQIDFAAPGGSLTINGNSPMFGDAGVPPGDTLHLDFSQLTSVPILTLGGTPGSGTFAFQTPDVERPLVFNGIESLSTNGVPFHLVLDMRLSGFEDGMTDVIGTQLDNSGDNLQLSVNSQDPFFEVAAANVLSLTVIGSDDDDAVIIRETAGGLPRFAGPARTVDNASIGGGQSVGGHLNAAASAFLSNQFGGMFDARHVGIHFDGGEGANRLGVEFTSEHDAQYTSDTLDSANSGNISAVSAGPIGAALDGPGGGPDLLLSFANLAPIDFIGAGGSLLLDASATPATTSLTISDDNAPNDGRNQVSGDGGFETTAFVGFDDLLVRGGGSSDGAGETITLQSLDASVPATRPPLRSVRIDGGDIFGADPDADTINIQPISAAVTVAATGAAGDDRFNVSPSQLAAIEVVGGDPSLPASPGDTLIFDRPPGESILVANPSPGAGTIVTTGGFTNVDFREIESSNLVATVDIEKLANGQDADVPTGPEILRGSSITFTYTVTNTGEVPLENVQVIDEQLGPITNLVGNGNGDTMLNPGETWVYEDSTTVTVGQNVNTATVAADELTETVSGPILDSDQSHYFGVIDSPTFFTNEDEAIEINLVDNLPPGVFVFVPSTSRWGASLTMLPNGNVQYDPTTSGILQVLPTEVTVQDAFDFTFVSMPDRTALASALVSSGTATIQVEGRANIEIDLTLDWGPTLAIDPDNDGNAPDEVALDLDDNGDLIVTINGVLLPTEPIQMAPVGSTSTGHIPINDQIDITTGGDPLVINGLYVDPGNQTIRLGIFSGEDVHVQYQTRLNLATADAAGSLTVHALGDITNAGSVRAATIQLTTSAGGNGESLGKLATAAVSANPPTADININAPLSATAGSIVMISAGDLSIAADVAAPGQVMGMAGGVVSLSALVGSGTGDVERVAPELTALAAKALLTPFSPQQVISGRFGAAVDQGNNFTLSINWDDGTPPLVMTGLSPDGGVLSLTARATEVGGPVNYMARHEYDIIALLASGKFEIAPKVMLTNDPNIVFADGTGRDLNETAIELPARVVGGPPVLFTDDHSDFPPLFSGPGVNDRPPSDAGLGLSADEFLVVTQTTTRRLQEERLFLFRRGTFELVKATDEAQQFGRKLFLVKINIGPDGETIVDAEQQLPVEWLEDVDGMFQQLKQKEIPNGLYDFILREDGFPPRKAFRVRYADGSFSDPIKEPGRGSQPLPEANDQQGQPAGEQNPGGDGPAGDANVETTGGTTRVDPVPGDRATSSAGMGAAPLVAAVAVAQLRQKKWSDRVDALMEGCDASKLSKGARLRRRLRRHLGLSN